MSKEIVATRFNADGSASVVARKPLQKRKTHVDHFSLEDMQKWVGGYVQILQAGDGRAFVLCDEDGQPKGLPLNQHASMVAGRPIVGPAVVVSLADD